MGGGRGKEGICRHITQHPGQVEPLTQVSTLWDGILCMCCCCGHLGVTGLQCPFTRLLGQSEAS